ncbi:MAG TPA: chemotaxis protein CheA [Gammaproteobacteria bacterium]|nr:chemotaxis protein CheA [Gammaproteobacteria bacterium]
MAMDMEQFHQTFFEESLEGLDLMESALLNLDVGAAEPEAINSIFRAAHSIKGGSGTFGFLDIANFTHLMETLLDEMRDGRRQVVQSEADLLLRAVDGLRMLVAAAQGAAEVDEDVIAGLQAELQAALEQGPAAATSSTAATTPPGEQGTAAGWSIRFRPDLDMMRTGNDPLRILRELAGLGEIRVSADSERLPDWELMDPEACYLAWEIELRGEIPRDQVDEVFAWVADEAELDIQPLVAAVQAAVEESEPGTVVDGELLVERRRKERRSSGERRGGAGSGETTSIRVSIDKIDDLINMVGELVITQSMLGQIGDSLGQDNAQAKLEKLRDGLTALERNTRELQESVMRIRMLPISFAFNRFPRLVHDLGGKLGKQIDLRMSGENTELDKTVMEKIGDPLVHLVRNALDHGLETPEVRLAAGKPATGTLLLNAYHQGGNIVIEISDDGAGINRRKVLAKALERGLLSEAEAATLPDDKICDLIFQPGFSTADVVSDVSGRGVGMDVVRRNIQDVGGSVELSSQEGQGSRITIRLPLTLAILDGQLVRVGGVIYIIPLVSIIESLQAKPEAINKVAGMAELYRSRDEYLPVIRLHRVFNIEADTEDLTKGLLVVAEGDGQKAGIFVDELLGQQQVVIKSLESNYRRVDGVSGATILGDGSVALIMDIPGLIRMTNLPTHDVERKRA